METFILLGVIAIALTVAIPAVIRNRRRLSRRTPRPGAAVVPVATPATASGISWAWLPPAPAPSTLYIIGALLFLEFILWYTEVTPWLFKGWGLIHIPIYIIAVLIFSGLEEHVKGRRYLLALIAMITALSIYGFHHMPGSWEKFRGWFSSNPSTSRLATTVPSMCDKVKREVSFRTDSWTNINQGGTCNPEGLWNNGNCFWSRRATWTNDPTNYGPHCTSGSSPRMSNGLKR